MIQTTMLSNETIKYFPWTPGIPWKLRYGKYIIPELSSILWKDLLDGKNITIVCFGGLVEAYFSLCILESINYIFPESKLFWAADIKYKALCDMQGLATFTSDFDPRISEKYPTPIFFDKQGNTYFNCLNNYCLVKSYYGTKGYKDKRFLSKQITEKSLIPWDQRFLPKFRKSILSQELEQWSRLLKLYSNIPSVLIFPDPTKYTIHNIKCLTWVPAQVKALGAMLKYKNINTIVFSDKPSVYYDPYLHILPSKLEYFFNLIPKAYAILAVDTDFLFLANSLSTAKLFTNHSRDQFDLKRNNNFLNKNNKIYKKTNFTPNYVFGNIIGNI